MAKKMKLRKPTKISEILVMFPNVTVRVGWLDDKVQAQGLFVPATEEQKAFAMKEWDRIQALMK